MSTPIGLFDSGLGGLTVLRELQQVRPAESYVYLGDNARAPYGTKSEATIVRYANECTQFLLEQKIKLLVVACNTASSLALSSLEQILSIPVIGTIEPAVTTALESSSSGVIGVIGTDATIASGAYQRALVARNPKINVVAKPCPLFVPIVEQGMVSGEIVDKIVEMYLQEFKNSEIDTLILGCTHYPLLAEAINAYLGDRVRIVECSKAIAQQVSKLMGNEVSNSQHVTRYYTTDSVGRFNHLAKLLITNGTVDAIQIAELPALAT